MSDHEASLRWKDQLGVNPNSPSQHSLWENIGVPGKNPRLSVSTFFHISIMCLHRQSNSQSQT